MVELALNARDRAVKKDVSLLSPGSTGNPTLQPGVERSYCLDPHNCMRLASLGVLPHVRANTWFKKSPKKLFEPNASMWPWGTARTSKA